MTNATRNDMKSRRGCRLGFSCYCPPHDHLREQGNERKLLRGESEGCQRACYLCFRTAVLHETHETAASQWICRAPARDVGKAKSYQFINQSFNPFRTHSANGYLSPIMFELCWQTCQLTIYSNYPRNAGKLNSHLIGLVVSIVVRSALTNRFIPHGLLKRGNAGIVTRRSTPRRYRNHKEVV